MIVQVQLDLLLLAAYAAWRGPVTARQIIAVFLGLLALRLAGVLIARMIVRLAWPRGGG